MGSGRIIYLPDVNPAIFGLFLLFIYRGAYPASVDAPRMKMLSPYGPTTPGATPASRTSPAPTPLPRTASPPSHPTDNVVPASIDAWILADRLAATGFMNHAIAYIYSGIGQYFALTPSLLDYVWTQTDPKANRQITTQPNSTTLGDNIPASSSPSTVISPSPLRNLLLHILVLHWATLNIQIIGKAPGTEGAWSALFDAHPDLRRGFIFGLQGPSQLLPVQGYFAKGGAVAAAATMVARRKETGNKLLDGVHVKKEDEVEAAAEGQKDVISGKAGERDNLKVEAKVDAKAADKMEGIVRTPT